MARRTHRGRRHDFTETPPSVNQETAISTRAAGTRLSPVAAWIIIEFGFFLPVFLSYGVWLEWISLRSWIATPCTIVSSAFPAAPKQPRLDAITYSYDFQGRPYQSNRYYFDLRPSRHTVRAHPAGQPAICYVNPADPKEAVLVSTLPHEASYLWLILLFPIGGICLILARLSLVVFSLAKRGRPTSDANGPTILQPRLTPPQDAALHGVLFAAFDVMVLGLWYGEIWMLGQGHAGWTEGVFFIIVLVPFSSLGIFGAFISGKKVLAVFNPRATLELAPGRIPLGGSALLSWRFTGRTESLRSVQIVLTGTEQAIRQVSRDAYAYRHVFHKTVLFHSYAPDRMIAGECRFVFPTETMHTFDSFHNSIYWSIVVRAQVALRPAIATHFRITVTPHEQAVA